MQVRDLGRQRMYRVNGEPLKSIHDWVKNYEQACNDRFDTLHDLLDELKGEDEGNGENG